MDEIWLAERFQAHQARLGAIAYRMLGSSAEAEDVIQQVWLRISGHGVDDVRNLDGWLTTVTARICLDHLRARARRPEEPLDTELPVTSTTRRRLPRWPTRSGSPCSWCWTPWPQPSAWHSYVPLR